MMSCSLPCCTHVWRQLHDRPGKHSSDHIWQGGSLQGTALSRGILLWPPPRLPEMYFHSAFCLANQNSPRFHAWPWFNRKSLVSGSDSLFFQVQPPFSFLLLILNLFFKDILQTSRRNIFLFTLLHAAEWYLSIFYNSCCAVMLLICCQNYDSGNVLQLFARISGIHTSDSASATESGSWNVMKTDSSVVIVSSLEFCLIFSHFFLMRIFRANI